MSRKGDQVLEWLPEPARELDAKLLVLKAEKERLLVEHESYKTTALRKEAVMVRLRGIKYEAELLRQQRKRSAEGMNAYYVDIVRDALGKPHDHIHKRILTECASRANGNPEQTIHIFPDDMIDALANSKSLVEKKMQAESKVHSVRQALQDAKLSMRGNLDIAEYDRRKAFNDLIEKLLRQLS